MTFRIKKNDTVLVTGGKDKGVTGKVLFVIPKEDRAIIEGVNFIKRHKRSKNPRAEPGGIIEKEAAIALSIPQIDVKMKSVTMGMKPKERAKFETNWQEKMDEYKKISGDLKSMLERYYVEH